MKSVRFFSLASLVFAASACSPPSMSTSDVQTTDAVVATDTQSPPADASTSDAPAADTSSTAFPAPCQERAVECPDQASLDRCEMGVFNSGCTYLPLIDCTRDPSDFRSQGTCPSAAQICRLESGNQGFCTHSCTMDSHCPLPGGGTGVCGAVGGTTTCMRQ